MNHFMQQTVKLVKEDGSIIGGIRCSVQDGVIYTNEPISVKCGEYFLFTNSLGEEEMLVVERRVVEEDGNGRFHHLKIFYHKDIK